MPKKKASATAKQSKARTAGKAAQTAKGVSKSEPKVRVAAKQSVIKNAKPAELPPVTQEQALGDKSEAQLKREVRARMRHLGPIASSEVVNDLFAKHVSGFTDFLREQSVVGLAIGLVLGTQIKQVVDQFIASFINPLVGLLLPGKGTLAEKAFTLSMGHKTATFGWGGFVMTLISFVFVAVIVYYVFKGLKLDKLTKKKS